MRMQDKVVIVTGGGSGLGRADAIRLAEEGARVVVTDINPDTGQATADACDGRFVQQDVGDEAGWQALIAQTVKAFGGLDALVNNAGIAIVADIEQTTAKQWRDTLRVHLDGTFFGCHYAIPAMRDSGGGSIVNMSSTAALVGIAPYLAYSAAKGGIRSMTKSIAAYCKAGKLPIRCNSVHPGSIHTPMVENALSTLAGVDLAGAEDPDAMRRALGIGEPRDVANMVLFLASDESKHVNGAEFVIDNADTIAPGSPRQ